jgi:hypothetical protein
VGTAYWFTAVWIGLVGAGMGLGLPVSMAVAMDDLEVARAGMGSALLQALRQAAGTIAVALLGMCWLPCIAANSVTSMWIRSATA